MYTLLFFVITFSPPSSPSSAPDDDSSGGHGPCQKLLHKRNGRVEFLSKLEKLMERNTLLQKKTPPHKKAVSKKLTHNHIRLKREQHLATLRLEKYEEQLIRKECPGVPVKSH